MAPADSPAGLAQRREPAACASGLSSSFFNLLSLLVVFHPFSRFSSALFLSSSFFLLPPGCSPTGLHHARFRGLGRATSTWPTVF